MDARALGHLAIVLYRWTHHKVRMLEGCILHAKVRHAAVMVQAHSAGTQATRQLRCVYVLYSIEQPLCYHALTMHTETHEH